MNKVIINSNPMKITNKCIFAPLFLGILLLFLTGCNRTTKAPPFPVFESEHAQPKIKNLTIPQPDTVHWVTENRPDLNALPTTKFDWDKLPAKPFDIGEPFSMRKPMTSKPFDWNALSSTAFSLETLPQTELKVNFQIIISPLLISFSSFSF